MVAAGLEAEVARLRDAGFAPPLRSQQRSATPSSTPRRPASCDRARPTAELVMTVPHAGGEFGGVGYKVSDGCADREPARRAKTTGPSLKIRRGGDGKARSPYTAFTKIPLGGPKRLSRRRATHDASLARPHERRRRASDPRDSRLTFVLGDIVDGRRCASSNAASAATGMPGFTPSQSVLVTGLMGRPDGTMNCSGVFW